MKKSLYFTILVCLLSWGFSLGLKAQEVVARKQRQELRSFYGKTLQVDSVKAGKVADIQVNYKAGVRALVADTSLTPALRDARIEVLKESKNQQLRKLLTPVQQEKVIPGTERYPAVKKD